MRLVRPFRPLRPFRPFLPLRLLPVLAAAPALAPAQHDPAFQATLEPLPAPSSPSDPPRQAILRCPANLFYRYSLQRSSSLAADSWITVLPRLYAVPSDATAASETVTVQLALPAGVGSTTSVSRTTDFASPSIQLSNAGDHAVLKSQSGDVVWDAAKEKKPLYAARQSPDGKHVILSFGSGEHDLYSLVPFRMVKHLPKSAPVERGTAFESWAWVDAARLVGVSAVEQSPDKLQNLTAAEREARWCERMLIYVYDFERAELQQVQIDGLPIPPVFEVSQIIEGGYLQIGAEVHGKGWQTVWVSVAKQ